MTIIKIEPLESGQHPIQSQSGRKTCWLDGWMEVPSNLESAVWGTAGFCDLEVKDGALKSVTPREIPKIPDPPHQYTDLELVHQEITKLELSAIEQGQAQTDLELMILGGADNV